MTWDGEAGEAGEAGLRRAGRLELVVTLPQFVPPYLRRAVRQRHVSWRRKAVVLGEGGSESTLRQAVRIVPDRHPPRHLAHRRELGL